MMMTIHDDFGGGKRSSWPGGGHGISVKPHLHSHIKYVQPQFPVRVEWFGSIGI